MRKCICLYSGGLDSRLVVKIISMQKSVEAVAFHGLHCFEGKETFSETRKTVEKDCIQLGAKQVVFKDMTPNIVKLLRNNKYGFGKNLNPCLDCRINTIRTAASLMGELGADFLATGEVIGQRPKSQQRHGMNAVTKTTAAEGLEGLLLRPLCAKLLDPTIPEKEGWINREQMYDINGRSRNRQMELAEEFEINNYPAPAGGCLLTDVSFSKKMRDLLEHNQDITNNDIDLLKFGRHYRLSKETVMIAARNAEEGDRLCDLSQATDNLYITTPKQGALVLLRGKVTEEARKIACGLAVFYSKYREEGIADIQHEIPGQKNSKCLPKCGIITPEQIDNMKTC